MTATTIENEAIALFSADGKHWFDADAPDQKRDLAWESNEAVTKIVIGTDPKGEADVTIDLPPDLADLFPNLTHLHLWRIGNLVEVPELPAGLKCLDTRGCRKLDVWSVLSEKLEALVIDRCALLPAPDRVSFPNLVELSLQGCTGLSESWLHRVLRENTNLSTLDAGDCTQLTRIPVWVDELVDIRLNGCTELKSLPKDWPSKLRRIELRNAAKVKRLPNFTASMDYIDLGGTRSLRQLPENRGNPRSLFLFGSGLRVPPVPEHGKSPTDNVAHRTEAYFADRELTGDGEVKRCKILVLGNGDAGKTCLSLAMTGRDPAQAEKLGSTHGIQFWDWDHEADVGGTMEPVQVHVWDFGGQEIYHNIHRLFMSKGAVFIVLWNPDQDGKQPEPSDHEYQDEWRPLEYWLDLIQIACPQNPRIAIVCSHHTESTPELESKWKEHVPSELEADCHCFYIDSLNGRGQIDDLQQWLEDEIGAVVTSEGSVVPSYWNIAQNMVESWVQRLDTDKSFAATHNQIHPDRFKQLLWQEIESVTSDANTFPKLRQAIESKAFELTQDRMDRTLDFLTNSGWIYWDRNLFEGRVIVGQKWALEGLYTILDRRLASPTYRELCRHDGRFTLPDLGRMAWDKMGFQHNEQSLLLSYMQQCGLCFQLRSADEAWREQNVYASFEHLPQAKELRLARDFQRRAATRNIATEELHFSKMHKQHWQDLLIHAGQQFGKNAQYAIDALTTETVDGHLILISCDLASGGLSGDIEISIAGPAAEERLPEITKLVKQFLPGAETSKGNESRFDATLGNVVEHEEVFISYAWNPLCNEDDSGIPQGYEEPVNQIEAFLESRSDTLVEGRPAKTIRLIRDKQVTRAGDSLRAFMQNGAQRPYVIIVHSDKYWKSPDCIYELDCLFKELHKKEKSVDKVLIPVEHMQSEIGDDRSRQAFLDFWKSYDGAVPTRLRLTRDELKARAQYLIQEFSDLVSDEADLNIVWSKGADAALTRIATRLDLAVPKGDE